MYRWEVIEKENLEIKHARELFSNGGSRKQLLARNRLFLYKDLRKWTESQKTRAHILFKEYPKVIEAYIYYPMSCVIFTTLIKEGESQ
jgi:hypothetical protein